DVILPVKKLRSGPSVISSERNPETNWVLSVLSVLLLSRTVETTTLGVASRLYFRESVNRCIYSFAAAIVGQRVTSHAANHFEEGRFHVGPLVHVAAGTSGG